MQVPQSLHVVRLAPLIIALLPEACVLQHVCNSFIDLVSYTHAQPSPNIVQLTLVGCQTQ